MNTSEIFFVIIKNDNGSWVPCYLCGLHRERGHAEVVMRGRHPDKNEIRAISMKEFDEMFSKDT